MTDLHEHPPALSLDSYAQILAHAGAVRDAAACADCPPTAAPIDVEELWVVHDRTDPTLANAAVLCARHAAQWARPHLARSATGGHPLTRRRIVPARPYLHAIEARED
ncbi:hypothetical protein [Demequina silvatica]|uniref:hypothetical protein n=1 Tax=Demequina silvatica TaxID=1638988 RepID=UPI0007822578|nr:hypothetical protein [Demequina silvatica]